MENEDHAASVELTAEIVSAYVSNNAVRSADLPGLILAVHAGLIGIGRSEPVPPEPVKLTPAVSVKKSITDDFIVSLEDGRKLKSMKRYLAKLGMTPEQYRAKWGLPADYPMVAPSYARMRGELARSIGLGRKAADEAGAPAPKRGRAKAA